MKRLLTILLLAVPLGCFAIFATPLGGYLMGPHTAPVGTRPLNGSLGTKPLFVDTIDCEYPVFVQGLMLSSRRYVDSSIAASQQGDDSMLSVANLQVTGIQTSQNGNDSTLVIHNGMIEARQATIRATATLVNGQVTVINSSVKTTSIITANFRVKNSSSTISVAYSVAPSDQFNGSFIIRGYSAAGTQNTNDQSTVTYTITQ